MIVKGQWHVDEALTDAISDTPDFCGLSIGLLVEWQVPEMIVVHGDDSCPRWIFHDSWNTEDGKRMFR